MHQLLKWYKLKNVYNYKSHNSTLKLNIFIKKKEHDKFIYFSEDDKVEMSKGGKG